MQLQEPGVCWLVCRTCSGVMLSNPSSTNTGLMGVARYALPSAGREQGVSATSVLLPVC